MPIDALPAKLVVRSRQELHDRFGKWVLVRNPNEDIRQGSQVDQDAWVWADAGSFLLSNAVVIAGAITRANMHGSQLDAEAKRLGTVRQGAQGAGGAVAVLASSLGAGLVAGDVITYLPQNLRYRVTTTGTYANGQAVPIVGIDTGPQTTIPAGSILTWQSLRPGVASINATVIQQADGSGLSGGSGPETDDALRFRLDYLAANPPASGNDSQYQSAINTTSGVAIQFCFTVPGVRGPGSIAVMFTLRPGQPGANRIPTPAQLALALSLVGGLMPASDGIYMCTLVAQPTTICLKTVWATGAAGWADSTIFPLYHASVSTPGDRLVAASPNAGGVLGALAFRLSSASMTEVPQVGQSIGFFDQVNLVFRRKKILSVTTISGTAYDITVDTNSGISDTSYIPLNGQACCPWSDSLNSLVLPVVTYFDQLGPGEQFANFFDPGLRQKRSPPSPQYFPNVITNRLLGGAPVPVPPQGVQQNQPPVATLFTTPTLFDVQLADPASLPYGTSVGSPGVFSNLLTLGPSLVAFPE